MSHEIKLPKWAEELAIELRLIPETIEFDVTNEPIDEDVNALTGLEDIKIVVTGKYEPDYTEAGSGDEKEKNNDLR